MPRASMLTFEEITRIAKIFVDHGVQKIRLTGGEPLLRKHVENLIEMLSRLKTYDGKDLDLTLASGSAWKKPSPERCRIKPGYCLWMH